MEIILETEKTIIFYKAFFKYFPFTKKEILPEAQKYCRILTLMLTWGLKTADLKSSDCATRSANTCTIEMASALFACNTRKGNGQMMAKTKGSRDNMNSFSVH